MTATILRWSGTNRRGTEYRGAIEPAHLGEFVKAKYAAGWKTLTVDRDGEEYGGISAYTGRRVWWYDQPDAHVHTPQDGTWKPITAEVWQATCAGCGATIRKREGYGLDWPWTTRT